MIMTAFWRDEYVISITRDERDFFLYLLTSPDIAYAGIGIIPEKVMVMDLGFSRDAIQFCKKQLEKSERVLFYENWVCLPNFWVHNPMMRNESVIEATGKYLDRLPARIYNYFNQKLKEMEAPMSLDDYKEKRRRYKAKKMIRKQKPYLVGQQLDDEVDRVLGVSDSGVMDWGAIKKLEPSAYPTPESITQAEIKTVAEQFSVRPYHLHWVFMQKLTKLNATGRKRHDYLAFLQDCATAALKNELSHDEKVTAALFWARYIGVTITRAEAEKMIFKGEL